ncbi:MAG: hypothetical protein ACRYG5_09900 [Janthinobacterium lividum]
MSADQQVSRLDALRLADELDEMAGRITQRSNTRGDGLCTQAADMLRLLAPSAEAQPADEWLKAALELIVGYKDGFVRWPAIREHLCERTAQPSEVETDRWLAECKRLALNWINVPAGAQAKAAFELMTEHWRSAVKPSEPARVEVPQ